VNAWGESKKRNLGEGVGSRNQYKPYIFGVGDKGIRHYEFLSSRIFSILIGLCVALGILDLQNT